jgi:hypothetical protein
MWSHLEYVALNTSSPNVGSLHIQLSDDIWYQDIYNYLTTAMYPDGYNRIQKRALQHKAKQYRLIGGDLFFVLRGVQKRCIQKHEIAELLYNAHDQEGHFVINLTMRKLRQYYWPTIASDVRRYIEGCLQCAKHGIAVRSQTLSPISINKPNELWGMDFIGPFPLTELTTKEWLRISWPGIEHFNNQGFTIDTSALYTNKTFTYILLIVDYFSRFV